MSVFPGLGSLRAFHRLGMRGALSGSKAPFREAQGPELVAGLTTLGPSKGRLKRRVPVCLCGNLVLQPVVPVAWMSVIPIHGQAHAVINGNVEQKAFREVGGSHGHRSIRRSLNAGRVAFQAFCASGRAVVMTKFARPESVEARSTAGRHGRLPLDRRKCLNRAMEQEPRIPLGAEQRPEVEPKAPDGDAPEKLHLGTAAMELLRGGKDSDGDARKELRLARIFHKFLRRTGVLVR